MNLKRLFSWGMPAPSGQGPAPRASTSPPRSRSPQLDGMPGSPAVRCSLGPPAPRTTAFSDLPVEVLGLIAHMLSEGPPAKAGRDLANASMANRALRAAVAGDEHARRCMTLARKARQLAGSLLSGIPDANQASLCLPVLGLLNPQEQTKLVQILLDSPPFYWTPSATFEKFVPQLANMNQRVLAGLAIQATGYTDDRPATEAIEGLSGGLAHFDEPSIDLLLDKATRLHKEKYRARALSGLSRGLAHMKPNQRQRLLRAAQDIGDKEAQGQVNASLCAQLKHLPLDDRDRLFDLAIYVPHTPPNRSAALESLAVSTEVLDEGQKETLLTEALKSNYPLGLANMVEHLDLAQRLRLVNWVLQDPSGQALVALRSGLKHVPPHQQDLLLEAAAHAEYWAKKISIGHFATALPSMEPAGRGKVGTLALGIVNDEDYKDEDEDEHEDAMARTIGALGPHLEYLEEDHRNSIAGRALRILNSYAAGKLDPSEGAKAPRELALGLGAGMGALREDLRDELVNAVAAFADRPDLFFREVSEHEYRAYKYKAYVKTFASVIAGLASGRQHLRGPQFQTLIDAASRMEERIEQARRERRVPSDMCDEMKAMVTFGLATA